MKTVLFFSGAACVKCSAVKKFWNEVVENNNQFNYSMVDTDKDLTLARKYKVMALPTFLIEENDAEVARISGEVSKKVLLDFLQRNK